MIKEIKLRELEKSHEAGIISDEEYEKQKEEIVEMPEEKIEEKQEEETKEVKLKSDKVLIIGIILIMVMFGIVFSLKYFFVQDKPQTIDDLHALNLKGKLKADQGYLYKGVYSFVKFDDLWYTQMVSPKGTRFYNIQFRYGPKEVEQIKVNGALNTDFFNNASEYYVTFNPTGGNFSSIALAVSDFNQQMTKVFFKQPIAACDRNETTACIDRPIITCDNTDKMVLYVKDSNTSMVEYDDNCITIEGKGFDLVKGVDRVLYGFYDIIKE